MKANGLLVSLLLASSSTALAHEAPIHEHAELVPIPAYDSQVEANAKNSLIALNALLETLSEDVLDQISFDLESRERHRWSNLPAGRTARPGVSFGEMSDGQRDLLFAFLSASLSEAGYQSVAEVMAAEAYLAADSKSGRMNWSPENYWLSIYGTPSNEGRWAWAFGGHHLALNISMDQGVVTSMSPSFVGSEPAKFSLNGIEYDVITDMHEAGYAIYETLSGSQKQQAALSRFPRSLAVGANKDGVVPIPVGISLSEMDEAQRHLALDAIYHWISHQPEENALPRMQEISRQLDQTYFGWYGEMSVSSRSYFRIQGPSLIIELQGGLGNVGNSAQGRGHYHTIYRNPTFDYGEAGRN